MSELLNPSTDDPNAYDKERERLHRQMLSTISHDLKTPIASIIGSLEVYERMKHRLAADKQEQLIQVALQEAHRLDSFVTNILDMAKFDNGMVKAKREPVEIAELLQDCVSKLGASLGARKVDVSGFKSLHATTDAALLSRAVGVVLDNATKYGGENAPISIDLATKNSEVLIVIRDHGPGIVAGMQNTIFEKYARFAVNGQHPSGMGLGLAIGRDIMRLLGGIVSATNHPDGGAVFVLRLPAV